MKIIDDDLLGIIYWELEDGRHYRCRGIGKMYSRFYDSFVPNSSYKCTGEDWPWDHFVFTDMNDHNRLLKEFPDAWIEKDKYEI